MANEILFIFFLEFNPVDIISWVISVTILIFVIQ